MASKSDILAVLMVVAMFGVMFAVIFTAGNGHTEYECPRCHHWMRYDGLQETDSGRSYGYCCPFCNAEGVTVYGPDTWNSTYVKGR